LVWWFYFIRGGLGCDTVFRNYRKLLKRARAEFIRLWREVVSVKTNSSLKEAGMREK